MLLLQFTFIVILYTSLTYGVACERLNEQIYTSIEGSAACFRRLNGSHQTGCSSSLSGAVGVVHMVNDLSDAQWIVNNATAGPYMPVVSTSMFNVVIPLLMMKSSNVAGVLLYENETMRPSTFSHDSRCPNEYYAGPGSKCSSSEVGGIVWNEMGTGLLKRDIPFPIFFIPQKKIDIINTIQQCFQRYNVDLNNQKGKPLCSLELNSFMFAAVDTVTCLRRSASSDFFTKTKVCDPISADNVYYSLFPFSKETETKPKSVTMVTARIDSASLFEGVAPGAASSVVGLVGLLATATVLAQMIPDTQANLYEQNVLFTMFNGEAFDYIGSQRVAYDISLSQWPPGAPLSPERLRLHVELGQIGGSMHLYNDSSWPMYAFAPYTAANIPPQITEFLAEFETYSSQVNMSVLAKFTSNLPPSSLHSFRRILKEATASGRLAEMVIADHDEVFTNRYYDSVLDDEHNINYKYHNITIGAGGVFVPTNVLLANGTMQEHEPQVKVARLATALARTLYQQVTGKPYAGNVAASAHMVDEIMYCFLRSQACPVLAAAEYAGAEPGAAPSVPASLYVGVAVGSSPGALYAGHILALLTGRQLTNSSKTACDQMSQPGYTYYWLRGWNHSGVCVQTTMNFSVAISPAFTQPDYDMRSGVYSSWTESVWKSMSARLFVQAGGAGAHWALAAGTLSTVIAAVLTRRLSYHAIGLFPNTPAPATAGILGTVNC